MRWILTELTSPSMRKTGLCEKVILAVLAAQEEYLDSIWGENMDEEDKA